jgi:WD40 repeat protein/tRNA A-37 threonylcarbamoyl transferase component Bud32
MSVEERLADLLVRWEEQKEQGQPVTPEELCRDCPELLDELRRRIQALESLNPALATASSSPTGTAATEMAHTIVEDSGSALRRARAVPGYDILGELGRGGMGVVYKARQKSLDRIVALKMILAGAHAGQQQRERFRGEAEAAARLQHANIVQVYEIGEHERCPYIALEYIDGRGLNDILNESRPLAPVEAAALVEQLAQAVHYAHQRGIVHRDLKPSNILLTQEGTAKITDFGLAKRLEGGTSNTRTGDIIGTPCYMAPEQAAGESREIGPGTDIYSLGVILYEMLTGKPPFEGTSAFDTVYLVITAEPERPSRHNPRVPPDLETICLKCLEKAPAKRYDSARALAEDLRRFQRGEPIEARPIGWLERGVKWVRRRPAVSALLGLLLISLLALLIGGWVSVLKLYQGNQSLQAARKKQHADLVRLNVTNGTHYLQEGDLFASLIWFARALKLEEDETRLEAHRIRIAAVLRECPRLSQLWVHDDGLRDVAFSPDGRWVVTASSDRTARVFDVASGVPRFEPPLQHESFVFRASLSPDGGRIVTASADKTARIWDAANGQSIATLIGHKGTVRDARFRSDGKQIVTGGDDKTARLWEAATGKFLHAPLLHDGAVIHASFHPDGNHILTASADGSARIWRIGSDSIKEVARMRHNAALTNACFDREGKRVATASEDETARVWDAVNGQPITPPLRHYGSVQYVTFSPDGRRLATAGADLKAWVWDAKTGLVLLPPLRHESAVCCVEFSPDGTRLLTSSDDNTVRIWDGANGRPLTPPLVHNGTVVRACFSPDGRRIVTADKDTTARLYDLVPATPPVPPLQHGKPLWQATFDPQGSRVLTAGTDTARIWDAKTGKLLIELRGHKGPVLRATYDSDGGRIVTASGDATARVWDAASGRTIATLEGHKGPLTTAEFSPNGQHVLTASADATARIWDAATGKAILVLSEREYHHQKEVLDAVFSSDGRRVATASVDYTARIWDAATGEPIGKIMQHKRRVVRVAFSPDGRRLATASFDQTAQIWNADTGEALLDAPLQHPGPVRDICFRPDGLAVMTTGEDNTARVWDASTGKPLLPALRHSGTVTMADFSANGKWIVTASDDNSGRVWDGTTGEPLTPALRHRGWGRITYAAFNSAGDRVVTASEDGTAQVRELGSKDLPNGDLERFAELLGGNSIGEDAGSRVPLDARELQRLWNELRK